MLKIISQIVSLSFIKATIGNIVVIKFTIVIYPQNYVNPDFFSTRACGDVCVSCTLDTDFRTDKAVVKLGWQHFEHHSSESLFEILVFDNVNQWVDEAVGELGQYRQAEGPAAEVNCDDTEVLQTPQKFDW